jgi:D-alanyl-D-alanine dipeptidase
MKNAISRFHFIILISILCFPALLQGQDKKQNPYGLTILSDIQVYRDKCNENEVWCLVNLEDAIPGILLDIRYATDNNFTKRKVYTSAHAFLRKPAAEALALVQQDLAGQGLVLKVFDAYRPYAATLVFWDLIKDTLYVASPRQGSRHNRGCAVDVTLVDLKTGMEVEMPTAFDEFSINASAAYPDVTEKAKANRAVLINAMQNRGFRVIDSEWWHFDYEGWSRFDLMDISFEELLAP